MARIFITGSADGLGKRAAQLLVEQKHSVVSHARNDKRAKDALAAVPGAETAVVGDLGSMSAMRSVAEQINHLGALDAVIHNAAIGYGDKSRVETADGLPATFAINSLAPYILTALIQRPKRLIYVSSGLHKHVDPSTLDDMLWTRRKWQASEAYSESKFHNVMLAFAAARLWPDVFSNSIDPGWVPTKMGGPQAPDGLDEGSETQAWLAASDDPAVHVSGQHFYHRKRASPNSAARDVTMQQHFLTECERISGISLNAQSSAQA